MALLEKTAKIYYTALLKKDANYEGVFFGDVKKRGVFCRSTCPARKQKFENCEFFENAHDALIASYRPCKRCAPLLPLGEASNIAKALVNSIEDNTEKKWIDKDFEEISTDSVTVRRHFKQRFGMTFAQYVRARRMGIAFKQIRQGSFVIHSGYESGSSSREAFYKIIGITPSEAFSHSQLVLKASWIDTLLGPMIAISDDNSLYLLEFADCRGLEKKIERLKKRQKAAIIPGSTDPIAMISQELGLYFSGTLKSFKTPLHLIGSDFQRCAWRALQQIPYGQTRSYKTQAEITGNEKAYRAVANANGANQLAIIIPCHRIINHNGDLGGYGGGKARKEWLLKHEKSHA